MLKVDYFCCLCNTSASELLKSEQTKEFIVVLTFYIYSDLLYKYCIITV